MKGQKYSKIIEKLVTNGRWRILDSEEGFARLFTWTNDTTSVLEINHKDGIVTDVYKYSY